MDPPAGNEDLQEREALIKFIADCEPEAPKPNATSIWRYRWILGLTLKIWGRLEDLRWILQQGNEDLQEAQPLSTVYPVSRKHYKEVDREVQRGTPGDDDQYFHTDRHRPGPAVARTPEERDSGCVLAAITGRVGLSRKAAKETNTNLGRFPTFSQAFAELRRKEEKQDDSGAPNSKAGQPAN